MALPKAISEKTEDPFGVKELLLCYLKVLILGCDLIFAILQMQHLTPVFKFQLCINSVPLSFKSISGCLHMIQLTKAHAAFEPRRKQL